VGQVTPFPAPDGGAALSAPTVLTADHVTAGFDCGTDALNEWLSRRALKNQLEHASRTYVICHGATVVGYYCIANGSVVHGVATGKVRRNMPDPIPVIVLGRLAVDTRWRGRQIGSGLLRDALLRTLQVSAISGVRALLVHAKDDEATRFYRSHGFHVSPIHPLTLMLSTREIESALR
jgi:GNAT superfamily N-acetyltransferase